MATGISLSGFHNARFGMPDPSPGSFNDTQTAKPWAYWWWMGSSVTRDGISKNLQEYRKSGLGGLHIIPIYGEKGDEENYIDFLSPEWMEMLVYTVDEANRLGLGIDMTTGTGWPFGGPAVTYSDAAKKMEVVEFKPDETSDIRQILQGTEGSQIVYLAAPNGDGKLLDITGSIRDGGQIIYEGRYQKAYALIMSPTLQKVKRAAPGGEGLVIDYFSKEAVNTYMDLFQKAFESTRFTEGMIRSFYNDSYEVYGANFTGSLPDEFEEKKQYKLTNYLDVLADPHDSELKSRIITDYCEVVSDLLYDHFATTWQKRCNALGMTTRNQAHGSPGNLIDLYTVADIPETESFGVSNFAIPGLRHDPDFEEERFGRPNPLTMKFASSAAHIKGKKLVSAETGTWLGNHFKVALSQVKPQADELFTAGINHIFYHGITYNPPEKPFPGRLFYASTNFGTRSHFHDELPALNRYIQNCQEQLQNSFPANDILIYFPIHDIWAAKYTDEWIVRFDVHHSGHWLKESRFGEVVSDLWNNGFTFDYLSDRLLKEAVVADNRVQFRGAAYKAVVIPECSYMPETTLAILKNLARKNIPVIFQNSLPESVPGYSNLEKRSLEFDKLKKETEPLVTVTNQINDALKRHNIQNEELAVSGLSFIRKTRNGETFYFISNLSDQFHSSGLFLAAEAEHVVRYDPLTGQKGVLESVARDGRTEVSLQLEPGQSCFLFCSNIEPDEPDWIDPVINGEPITIGCEWTLTAREPGPPESKFRELKSWTTLDEEWKTYSGKAVYKGEFTIDMKLSGKKMILHLTDVRETASVKINGYDLGLLWCIPFKTVIPEGVLKEKNTIEIEVTNLSFNEIIDLDKRGIHWKNFHDINMVDIRYNPFDASEKEPEDSGLTGEIRIYPFK